jgi:hypothetical protein
MAMRADFELNLAAELWNPGDIAAAGHMPDGFAEHAAVLRNDSLLLIPMFPRRARASTPQRWTDHMSTGSVLARRAFGLGLRTGLARPVLRHRIGIRTTAGDRDNPTLHEYLSAVFEQPEVAIAGTWGPPRPNQKPVLEVFDGSGNTLGFAKIGWNNLTRQLVDAEARFLQSTPRLRHIRIPRLIHHGEWRGNSISITEPELGPVGWRRASRPGPDILTELAGLSDRYRATLRTSPYRSLLANRAALPVTTRVAAALAAVDKRWGDHEFDFGHWHGDWAPWNMNSKGPRCIVWDWERTAPGMPVGLDSIHYTFHTAMASGRPPARALSHAAAVAGAELAPLGVPVPAIGALTLLYTIEMQTRFASSDVSWLAGLLPAALELFAGE